MENQNQETQNVKKDRTDDFLKTFPEWGTDPYEKIHVDMVKKVVLAAMLKEVQIANPEDIQNACMMYAYLVEILIGRKMTLDEFKACVAALWHVALSKSGSNERDEAMHEVIDLKFLNS